MRLIHDYFFDFLKEKESLLPTRRIMPEPLLEIESALNKKMELIVATNERLEKNLSDFSNLIHDSEERSKQYDALLTELLRLNERASVEYQKVMYQLAIAALDGYCKRSEKENPDAHEEKEMSQLLLNAKKWHSLAVVLHESSDKRRRPVIDSEIAPLRQKAENLMNRALSGKPR